MKKVLSLILSAMLATAMFAGCSSQQPTGAAGSEAAATADSGSAAESTGASGEKIVIAQSMPTLNDAWYVLYANGSKDMADVLGADINQVTNPENNTWSPDAQINKIENLIALKPSVLEIDPTSTDGINAAIDEAKRQGIPVVVSGINVSTDVDCTLTADNYQGGVLCGNWMGQILSGEGRIVVLEATPGRDIMQNRVDGFLEGVSEYPGVEIVAQQVANSERATAVTVMESILQAHPDIDAVWAANDEMALGALEALRSIGRVGDVIVGGFNATPDALDAIQRGEMHYTADQVPYEIGVRSVAISYMVATGMEPPAKDIQLNMTLVSTENIKEFMEEQETAQKALIEKVREEYGI